MNVIFLDVDGELTYQNYHNPETENIDIEKVKLLKEICDKTDAKVVISSSWRGAPDWTPPMYHTLRKVLADNGIEVLGNTPHISPRYENWPLANEPLSFEAISHTKPVHGTVGQQKSNNG